MPKLLGAIDNGNFVTTKSVKDFSTQKKLDLKYLVLADNISQTEDDILATSGLPPLRAVFGGAYVKDQLTRTIGDLVWEVGIKLDSHIDSDASEEDKDPENRRHRVSWSAETQMEVLEADALDPDVGILNAVEEPLITEGPITIPILRVDTVQVTFSPNTILNYENHVNDKPFLGAPKGSCLCASIEDDEEFINGIEYRRVVIVFKFNIKKSAGGVLLQDTWQVKLLNEGTKFKRNAADPPDLWEAFKDRNGNPTTGNLAADGTVLPPGASPVFLPYNRYPEADFDTLPIIIY